MQAVVGEKQALPCNITTHTQLFFSEDEYVALQHENTSQTLSLPGMVETACRTRSYLHTNIDTIDDETVCFYSSLEVEIFRAVWFASEKIRVLKTF